MNRKDREITNRQEIINVLKRCEVIRLGLTYGDSAYIVPVSFGMEIANDEPIIYIHSAKKGIKVDYINVNKNVCIEADIYYKVEPLKMGITARYESVIGFGTITEVPKMKKFLVLKEF